MNSTALYVLGIIVAIPATAVMSKGFCGKSFQKGKWESYGDCDDAAKNSILQELDEKKEVMDAATGTAADRERVCYMGLKSRSIPDSSMTASSFYRLGIEAYRGRLDNKDVGINIGAWCMDRALLADYRKHWIQVDFGSPVDIAGVITQGDPRTSFSDQYVSSYRISCGNEETKMNFVTENGSQKIFNGNYANDTTVYNKFPQILKCRFIRLYLQEYNSFPCVRMEFVAGKCFDMFSL